ncbi:hypothetical protein L1987_44398 [Smallanthus sonchifolius]|uniref:Uncharacterized protein n=1 Tax=Smallanthus sonchifolius TaxID=185202 RepID=A0ACB9GPG5_9ASTR|nr:hypothetical protein L1987_44398 [Smallanthus sonchifolius]
MLPDHYTDLITRHAHPVSSRLPSNPNSNATFFTSGILYSISSRLFNLHNRWILSKSHLFQSISSGVDGVE